MTTDAPLSNSEGKPYREALEKPREALRQHLLANGHHQGWPITEQLIDALIEAATEARLSAIAAPKLAEMAPLITAAQEYAKWQHAYVDAANKDSMAYFTLPDGSHIPTKLSQAREILITTAASVKYDT